MANTVLLNNVDHHDLRVVTGHGAEFGDSVNQVLIFPTEFEAVQREYPIFFRQDASGEFQAVALLGLDRDENLFLGDDRWQGRYIPAVQQRGPFSIGLQAADAESGAVIHVDLGHPRIDATGEAVFLPHGGNSPYLNHIAGVLRTIYTGIESAPAMFAAFAALDLIQPVAVDIRLADARQYMLPDLYTIGQDRFSGLGGDDLGLLHRQGFLAAALWALSSLGNVERLIELKTARLGSAQR
jgi:hypothetical protein